MRNDDFDTAEQTIADLMRTPVGRRWLLKAGFSAAAVAGLPAFGAAATTPQALTDRLGDALTSPQSLTLHFALGAAAGLADLTVLANGRTVSLTPHTRTTRAALGSQGTVWRKLRTTQLTHFATVRVPRNRALPLWVFATRRGKRVIVAEGFSVPAWATRALALAAFKLERSYRSVAGCPQRLAGLGLSASRLTSADEIVDLHRILDSQSTAIALVMKHLSIATVDPTNAATTTSLLGQTSEVCTLGCYIDQMQNNGEDLATQVTAVDGSGNPSGFAIPSKSSPPVTGTLTTIQLNQTDTTFTGNLTSALVAGIQGVRDTGSLGKVIDEPIAQLDDPTDTSTWHQPEGIVVTPTPYVPPGGVGGGVQVQVTNPGLVGGTKTVISGPLSGTQLPLTLYNNFVRFVWVYVQYLKADGTNLSLNPNTAYPNTPYSQSVGLLPQICTVLGIPLWDTNTITPTLNFPPEATAARLLFCGLGLDVVSGEWRGFFPPDAYPDQIAPQGEVLFPALMTGIMSIGLTSFALLTDLDIGTTWASVKSIIQQDTEALEHLLVDLLTGPPILSGTEVFATLVAAGGATYEQVASHSSSPGSLWNLLLPIASIIPKILFNPSPTPLWEEIALAIVGDETAEKIVECMPLIGEIVGLISAAGDALTLAQAIGETLGSPWVIPNQISLTYAATVTVSRDTAHNAATWPVTARSWRLDATIDGAVVPLSSNTGSLNAGGAIQSDPIVVQLNAPFGGKTITWSFVVLDATGNQVGTGVAQLPNNDPANPPSTVSFSITELPATVDANTLFQRTDTTTFNPTAGGYTWSDTIVDTGTVAASGIQEVTGVAIATPLGVAGIVWKQANKYWLRGVPVAQNGTTISLGSATRQGYGRRPFLLFDAFVDAEDVGNHVLLEPNDGDSGYSIRSLAIDPTTGDLSWDPTVSLGYFSLPITAAGLHSSGRVVALTAGGRFAQVQPAPTPRPPAAAYSAGPGDAIGLLRNPTAVAITNPGVVLVLEAGAARLSAFDLNGNPVRYFGNSAPLAFRLALSRTVTYLDVAVDGSGQIYLLYYQGTGAQPANYSINVYTPNGTPLATNSPGTNVPHLAVDYWRSIFAANYTALSDSSTGQPHIDPTLGVAEPSLSRFDPTS